MGLNLNLPDPEKEKSTKKEVEKVLLNVKSLVEDKYDSQILVLITTSSTFNDDRENVISYAVYLSFVGKNKFSYRLMEINCKNADGGLPVEVNAFTGPMKEFGTATTSDELDTKINEVFNDDRTRNIILSNYKM